LRCKLGFIFNIEGPGLGLESPGLGLGLGLKSPGLGLGLGLATLALTTSLAILNFYQARAIQVKNSENFVS
jgi:hypothetical protein